MSNVSHATQLDEQAIETVLCGSEPTPGAAVARARTARGQYEPSKYASSSGTLCASHFIDIQLTVHVWSTRLRPVHLPTEARRLVTLGVAVRDEKEGVLSTGDRGLEVYNGRVVEGGVRPSCK